MASHHVSGYVGAYTLHGASEAPTILLSDTFVVSRAAYDFRLRQ
jgi:hypothetical protein